MLRADDEIGIERPGGGRVRWRVVELLEEPGRKVERAIRFDRFHAAAPVCSPTRASVLTGRTPNRMATFKWGHPIRPQEVTVAWC